MPSKVHIPPLTLTTQLPIFDKNGTNVYYITHDQLQDNPDKASLLHDYNVLGPYMRAEHYLCPEQHKCPDIDHCNMIHLVPTLTPEAVPHKMVHRNSDKNVYPMHPAGMTAPVYDHTTLKTNNYDSGSMVITAGSKKYFSGLSSVKDEAASTNSSLGSVDASLIGDNPILPTKATPPINGGGVGTLRMQQCSHFQRGMCYQGAECPFLHILHYERQPNSKKISPVPHSSSFPSNNNTMKNQPLQQQQQQPQVKLVAASPSLVPIVGSNAMTVNNTNQLPFSFPTMSAPGPFQQQVYPLPPQQMYMPATSYFPQSQPTSIIYIQQPQQQQQMFTPQMVVSANTGYATYSAPTTTNTQPVLYYAVL